MGITSSSEAVYAFMVSTDSAGRRIQYYVVVLVADSFHLFPEDILAPNAGKFKLHAGKQDIRSDNVADPAFWTASEISQFPLKTS